MMMGDMGGDCPVEVNTGAEMFRTCPCVRFLPAGREDGGFDSFSDTVIPRSESFKPLPVCVSTGPKADRSLGESGCSSVGESGIRGRVERGERGNVQSVLEEENEEWSDCCCRGLGTGFERLTRGSAAFTDEVVPALGRGLLFWRNARMLSARLAGCVLEPLERESLGE